MSSRIAVVYYSATGNTALMARAIEAGAQEAGAEVRVRAVLETAPQEAIDRNQRWKDYLESGDRPPAPLLEDLE